MASVPETCQCWSAPRPVRYSDLRRTHDRWGMEEEARRVAGPGRPEGKRRHLGIERGPQARAAGVAGKPEERASVSPGLYGL
jgi:hypothetical protein